MNAEHFFIGFTYFEGGWRDGILGLEIICFLERKIAFY